MSWLRSALLVAAVSMLVVSRAESRPYAYVTNEASGTVSIIDTQTDEVTSTFAVGARPRGIATSLDGARLYIGHRTGTLIERDLYADRESARMAVDGPVKAIRRNPDGKALSVVLDDSHAVELVDMAMLRATKTIAIDGKNADDAIFSPDGRWIYANAKSGQSVAVIDAAKGAVIGSIPVGGHPRSLAFRPDGSRAYVTVAATKELVVIDVPRHAVVARVESTATLDAVAVHPDGERVFVSAAGAGRIEVLDASSNRFIASIDVGASPADMAFTSDGTRLYVPCRLSNEVAVIDTSTYERIESVRVGAQPSAIVIGDRPNLPRDGG